MHVRDEQVGAWWSPSDGAAYDTEYSGLVLRWHPYWQMTFAQYRDLHPDGEVAMYAGSVDETYHRNPRHGHGHDAFPGSPGIEPFFLASGWALSGEPDDRLQENEMVIAINEPNALRVYPLDHVQRDGGATHDRAGGRDIVVLVPENSLASAVYDVAVEGQRLSFVRRGDRFVDDQTGSVWTIEGMAESGSLAGAMLAPLEWQSLEWHTFASAHPDADIYQSPSPPRLEPSPNPAFRSLVESLAAGGHAVTSAFSIWPHYQAVAAIDAYRFYVGADRLEVFQFDDDVDAADFAMLDAHDVRFGSYVLRSNPERHFSNWGQTRLLRDKHVTWSQLLTDDGFLGLIAAALRDHQPATSKPIGADDIFQDLRAAGFPVRTLGSRWYPGRNFDAGPCWINGIPFSALDGFRAVIDGDCFLVYRFQDDADAHAYWEFDRHCSVRMGWIVLRSDPPGQYQAPYPLLSYDTPIDEVKWSRLLENEQFLGCCREIADRRGLEMEAPRA